MANYNIIQINVAQKMGYALDNEGLNAFITKYAVDFRAAYERFSSDEISDDELINKIVTELEK